MKALWLARKLDSNGTFLQVTGFRCNLRVIPKPSCGFIPHRFILSGNRIQMQAHVTEDLEDQVNATHLWRLGLLSPRNGKATIVTRCGRAESAE